MEDGKDVSSLDSVPKKSLDVMAQLQTVLLETEELRMAAVAAIDKHIDIFTRSVGDRAGHGRLVRRPGETFMQLLTRYHEEGEALKRRKSGRLPRAEAEFWLLRPRKTMVKGRYTIDAIMLSHIMRHRAAKRALSYASVNELTRAGAQRMVEGFDELPDQLRPRLQHPNTDTLHDKALHTIFMQWFLENVGLQSVLQFAQDELSKRKRAFSVHTLIGTSARDGERSTEMVGFPELHPDDNGHTKTGENIGDSMWLTLVRLLQPGSGRSPVFVLTATARRFIKNVQWGLLDSCSTNTGFYHGAHTVLRKKMHAEADHILYFMFLCLAHIASNEYGEGLALLQHAPDGSSHRQLFSRKRVVRAESSKEVPRLVGVIEDVGYVAVHTRGVMSYLKKKRKLKRLRKPDLGVITRWLYDDDLLEWILETTAEAKAKEAAETEARALARLHLLEQNVKAKARDITAAKLAVEEAAEAAQEAQEAAVQGRPADIFERLDDIIECLLHVWTDDLVDSTEAEAAETDDTDETGEAAAAKAAANEESPSEAEEAAEEEAEDEAAEESPELAAEDQQLLGGWASRYARSLSPGEIMHRMAALEEVQTKQAKQRHALLLELINPDVRIWMVAIKLYGTEVPSLGLNPNLWCQPELMLTLRFHLLDPLPPGEASSALYRGDRSAGDEDASCCALPGRAVLGNSQHQVGGQAACRRERVS